MNVRTIVLVLGIFALLSTATGSYLQYHSAKESALKQAEGELLDVSQRLKDNVLDLISFNQTQVKILANFVQIQEPLLNLNPETVLQANLILDHFAETLAYDVGYLMDASGNIIASSNRNQMDSFDGQNYSFRPYFIEAIQGTPSIYLAVGVTSGTRGLYFSHPVYREGGGRPIGVAVIKVSTRDIDSEFSRVRIGTELLVDKSGMIFVSNREDWTLNLLWRVLPEQLTQIEKTQQFGKGPWTWTGLEKIGDNHAVNASGEEYLIHETSIENCPGWMVVSLYSQKVISGRFVDPLVGKTGYVALFLCFLVGGAVVVLYVVAQRDIHSRKQAEEALRQSEEKFSKAFFLSPDAISISRLVDGTFVSVNEGFRHIFGYTEAEVIGKTSLDLPIWDKPEHRNRWIEELKTEGKVDHFEVRFRTKDGDIRYGLMSAAIVELNGIDHILNVTRDITRRKRAEEALKAEKQRFERLGENSPFGIVMIQPDGSFSYANPKFKEMFGYDLSDVPTGKEWFRKAYPDPDYRHEVISTWMNDVGDSAPGETRPHVFSVTCKDGTGKVIHFRPVKLDSGEDMMTCEDVTALKQAEQAVHNSEQMLKSILSTSPVGIGVSQDRVMKWANEAWIKMFGLSNEEECVGKSARMIYRSDNEYELAGKALYADLEPGKTTETDTKLCRKDGSVFDAHMRLQLLNSPGPDKVAIVAIADISDRKRVEEALREANERYERITNTMPGILYDYILRRDGSGKFLWLAGRCAEIFELETHDILNDVNSFWDLIHPEDVQRLHEEDVAANQEGIHFSSEVRIITPSGETKWIQLMSRPNPALQGEPAVWSGFILDITDRKRVEEELRKSEEKYRRIIDTANEGIWLLDDSQTTTFVNDKMAEMMGYTIADMMGKKPESFLFTEDIEDHQQRMERRGRGEPGAYEKRFRRKDGSQLWTRISATAIMDKEGNFQGGFGMFTDISHEKALQNRLLQSQKMEAVGTLAAGIAHNFNNMLQVILGYSDILLTEKNKGEPGHKELQKIVKTALEARDLVQRIRIFSKKADMQLVPMDLNHQIRELGQLLSHTLPKNIVIDIRLAEPPGMIKADTSLMDQMVMNLAINAGEAMPDGGSLTIETQKMLLDDDFCRLHAGLQPGPHVVLTVSDIGRGMSKDHVDKIFDPFFSTKQWDFHRGTGMGLSVVRGIVEQHEGYITVESEVGEGTTFRIYFPVLITQELPKVETRVDLSTGGSETILLVEDEELVRGLGVAILERAGYKVLAVADGQEALEVYEKEQSNISLVILDIVMPRMNGKECLQELLEINPSVKVLISSGVAQEDLVKDVVDLGAEGALLKPYGMKTLLEKVREVLDIG